MKRWWAAVAAATLTFLLGGLTAAVAHPAQRVWTPPADTIVKVTGDKANGFGIFYYDGSSIFPPTDSEAHAECGEYSTRVERIRCHTEVRVWYRDLSQLKRSINWALYSADTT
jgi:hypothetical protein